MEGVGARLGRSSTRYGPATVFSGPVRKWKKKWVPLASPANTNTANNSSNGNGNNNNHSHLLVYKWTPISPQSNGSASAAATPGADEPPRRRYRYVPINMQVSVLEDQKQEPTLKSDDENKTNDGNPSLRPSQPDGSDSKPDMNDVAMEDTQASEKDQVPTEETKETDLDLSLGLKAHDDDRGNGTKISEQSEGSGRAERVISGEDVQMRPATNSESENKLKRKAVVPDLEMRV